MTALRRLGVEYLRTVSRAGSDQTIWWYRSMLEILATRSDWPQREMMTELRLMSADLVRSLRREKRICEPNRSCWDCSWRSPRAWGARRRRFRSGRSDSFSSTTSTSADTSGDGRGGLARVATVRNRLADQGPVVLRPGRRCPQSERAEQVLRWPTDGRGLQRSQARLRHLRQS